MNRIAALALSVLLWLMVVSCKGQSRPKANPSNPQTPAQVDPFENSYFAFIGMPTIIDHIDTSAGWVDKGQKLHLQGIVYQSDGKTRASNILLYYYQTNVEGRYVHQVGRPRTMEPNEHGQTHGYIRGWVKTNARGEYQIYTVRPGVYPTRDAPAHIHMTVKEPNDIPEYYIDDIVFEDDSLVNATYQSKMELRGGNGIVRLQKQGELMQGVRNIQLGLQIPKYPK
jgi:protocatechuate 3,4-dioxygenase beta subunit